MNECASLTRFIFIGLYGNSMSQRRYEEGSKQTWQLCCEQHPLANIFRAYVRMTTYLLAAGNNSVFMHLVIIFSD